MPRVFPQDKFGHIVNMNLQREPGTEERLAIRTEEQFLITANKLVAEGLGSWIEMLVPVVQHDRIF